MESLKGKNAVITGAGKGIGKAVAIALAAEGVNVGLISRSGKDLLELKDELKKYAVKTAIAIADVADIQAVNAAIMSIHKELGIIDILINNAGIAKFGKFLELEPSEWEDQIKVNLFGVYYVTRAVLPQMIERQTGDIVNISSSAGLKGSPLTSAYSASKFGVMGLSDSLMQEVRKHNIRVTALNPSTVVTDLAISANLINNNEDRVMHPEDFAELIVAQLKLNRRVFVKDASIWSTNP
ncbi:MAG: 3-ketoacyl-ACP reductase [Sphingobacteriales bacterium 17-39-43]|uniref:3-ketoacyl-ACP reductase n=1 Tax=Daejeonella sp. TaxID=2805397 RepID=UPI000BCC2DA6|nr:3-ketoacyl-ACP reductase [Daejeonella sp.]OYX93835.1 MAG: 3-ketoacyl-ACP reductase [Sphingobacteriia bacterium 35-40-5]OYZ29222.1 MAG: 3-ketoacyl-ACP reductase [Sphingobacteriales bacterium 16-39-50]OZA22420.1 MAG: 3-ketoacyl-ACP reductase [Sphingobacteriales bacterium 17-39-43]HQS06821.1 3-ketoacyl-ACP reductase [Daejeonella sp.]HQT23383.1 3-ketoacyl-ACP reductase [Daejeonella sp.]